MFSFSTHLQIKHRQFKKIMSGENPSVPEYTKKDQNVGQSTMATSRKSIFVCGIHIPSHLECYYFVTADKPSLMESISDKMIK